MKIYSKTTFASALVSTLIIAPMAIADSIPSVVVTVKNQAAQRGGFHTPVWAGFHDGSFDIYDRNVALGDTTNNPNLISRESVERIAEDGITLNISQEFEQLQPGAAQTTFVAPGGPFQPGSQVSTTLNIDDPSLHRYFSYASMVIPSNDAFVANGSPVAHEIFNENGRFVAEDFIVAGDEVLDAGTEVNDEIAANTAFLNQSGPNIGVEENGVITLSDGFEEAGELVYPDGVLNHPAFANADFTADGARTLEFSFRFIDLGRTVALQSRLNADQEVAPERIESNATGGARLTTRNGDQIIVSLGFRGLTSAPVAAHLHLGQAGVNGPVVVDFTPALTSNGVRFTITAADIVGPLAQSADPFRSLLNELVAGNIYFNVHTPANPGGEIRGQVGLR